MNKNLSKKLNKNLKKISLINKINLLRKIKK